MEKQIWFCRTCSKRGVVEYNKPSGVYAVASLIRKSHRNASVGCTDDPQVLNSNHPEAKKIEEEIAMLSEAIS